MASKIAGQKRTGLLALTCECTDAAAVRDPVHLTGSYTVARADGTKPILGTVSVANVKRGTNGEYPVSETPGDVTVEARGFYTDTFKSAGALTAGIMVGFDASRRIAAVGAGVPEFGILLTTSTGANQDVDVLAR